MGARGHLRQVLGMRKVSARRRVREGWVSGALMYQERRMCFRSWVGMEAVTMRVGLQRRRVLLGRRNWRRQGGWVLTGGRGWRDPMLEGRAGGVRCGGYLCSYGDPRLRVFRV